MQPEGPTHAATVPEHNYTGELDPEHHNDNDEHDHYFNKQTVHNN